ncbi:MAG: acyl-CoA dehydrogenase [Rhodospirillales bacterium]|nr:acyl-CoA dehydrogenase [Rhodospirillales bacterium]
MEFVFTTEQSLLQDTARSFFEKVGGSAQIRRASQKEAGYLPEIWREIAATLGWGALVVPERFGGLGLGIVELAIIEEQIGATLYPSPFFATIVLALPAILAAGDEAQQRALIPAIVAGERTASLAYTGRAGVPGAIDAVIERTDGKLQISGEAGFVPYGHAVDWLVVAARTADRDGRISLVLLPRQSPGIVTERVAYLDPTHAVARIGFDSVAVPDGSVLGGLGSGDAALQRVLDRGAIALAAEQVGGAEKCLALSVEHAHQRIAFGRPIGSFQAIKHMLADMVVRIESARSAVYFAACMADEEPGEAGLSEAASMAAVHCSDAFYRTAADTIQVHGGMGFTWEHDAHLYFKRARCTRGMFGDPAFHCERMARAMGLA